MAVCSEPQFAAPDHGLQAARKGCMNYGGDGDIPRCLISGRQWEHRRAIRRRRRVVFLVGDYRVSHFGAGTSWSQARLGRNRAQKIAKLGPRFKAGAGLPLSMQVRPSTPLSGSQGSSAQDRGSGFLCEHRGRPMQPVFTPCRVWSRLSLLLSVQLSHHGQPPHLPVCHGHTTVTCAIHRQDEPTDPNFSTAIRSVCAVSSLPFAVWCGISTDLQSTTCLRPAFLGDGSAIDKPTPPHLETHPWLSVNGVVTTGRRSLSLVPA